MSRFIQVESAVNHKPSESTKFISTVQRVSNTKVHTQDHQMSNACLDNQQEIELNKYEENKILVSQNNNL